MGLNFYPHFPPRKGKCGEKVNTSLPSTDVHSGHILCCDACGFVQRIHPLLTQKVTELVSTGITDIEEVQGRLKSLDWTIKLD